MTRGRTTRGVEVAPGWGLKVLLGSPRSSLRREDGPAEAEDEADWLGTSPKARAKNLEKGPPEIETGGSVESGPGEEFLIGGGGERRRADVSGSGAGDESTLCPSTDTCLLDLYEALNTSSSGGMSSMSLLRRRRFGRGLMRDGSSPDFSSSDDMPPSR